MRLLSIFLLFILPLTHLFSQTIISDSVWTQQQRKITSSDLILSEYKDLGRVEQRNERRRISKFEFGAYFTAEYISDDFSDFKTELKSYNTDILNRSVSPLLFGITGNLNHYTLGLQFGSVTEDGNNHDSLKIKLNTTIYGVNLGYNLIDNRHWVVSPLISLKWYRYRLLNSPKNDQVSLTDYLLNRDIDIRINQGVCIAGINVAYKFYKHFILPCDFWTVGLQGGYPFKLHDSPLVYSKQNRLTSDNNINYGKYYLTFYFSFNMRTR